MRLGTKVIIGVLAISAGTLVGCHHGDRREAKSPSDAIAELGDPSWETRRHAADVLFDNIREPGGPRPDVLPALYAAAQREQEPHAYGAIIIALGASGIPEARQFIDPRIGDPSEDMRRWATRALKYWLVANGLFPKDAELPPPPGPLYGPPPPLPPNAPGSHPGLVGGPPPGAAPPGAPPGAPAAPAAPASPGPGPGGSI